MNEPISFQVKLGGSADISVPQNTAVYTDSFHFGDVNEFALSYIVSCTGLPNVKIQMEQSIVKPTTENAADVNFGVPRSCGDLDTALTSKTIQHMQLSPITLGYIRFKITDNNAGATDTVVNMWLSLQKKHPQ